MLNYILEVEQSRYLARQQRIEGDAAWICSPGAPIFFGSLFDLCCGAG